MIDRILVQLVGGTFDRRLRWRQSLNRQLIGVTEVGHFTLQHDDSSEKACQEGLILLRHPGVI